jgi:hypothetical protein
MSFTVIQTDRSGNVSHEPVVGPAWPTAWLAVLDVGRHTLAACGEYPSAVTTLVNDVHS